MTLARRVGVGLLLLAGCSNVPESYRTEIEAFRAERLTSLTKDDGWLTLAGLYWLKSGVNRVGTDAVADVVLPPGSAPANVGSLTLMDDGRLLVDLVPNLNVTIDGEAKHRGVLTSDAAGKPTLVKLGRLTFYVIARAERLGVRVKDNDSLVRRQFKGLEYFPIDPAWRVTARFEAFEPPREIPFATAIGTEDKALSPGQAVFVLAGQSYTLTATQDPGSDELAFVFGDATNQESTYGAGRFLDTPLPNDGQVVLDFNKAYSPPCAFTPYATCPLPTSANKLPIAIPAGERRPAHL